MTTLFCPMWWKFRTSILYCDVEFCFKMGSGLLLQIKDSVKIACQFYYARSVKLWRKCLFLWYQIISLSSHFNLIPEGFSNKILERCECDFQGIAYQHLKHLYIDFLNMGID